MREPKKISQFIPITETNGDEIIPILKDGLNKTVAARNLPLSEAAQDALIRKADKLWIDDNGIAWLPSISTDGWPQFYPVGDADAFLFGAFGGTII